MTSDGVYIGIENISLSASLKNAMVAALRALGPQSDEDDPQPAHINHWRVRNDGQAAIIEALFPDGSVTVASIRGFLADVFSVDPGTIGDSVTSTAYGPLVTYSHSGTDYIRFVQFGGVDPTWEQSRQAVLEYLAANSEDWNTE